MFYNWQAFLSFIPDSRKCIEYGPPKRGGKRDKAFEVTILQVIMKPILNLHQIRILSIIHLVKAKNHSLLLIKKLLMCHIMLVTVSFVDK